MIHTAVLDHDVKKSKGAKDVIDVERAKLMRLGAFDMKDFKAVVEDYFKS